MRTFSVSEPSFANSIFCSVDQAFLAFHVVVKIFSVIVTLQCPQCKKRFKVKEIINLYAPQVAVLNDELEKVSKISIPLSCFLRLSNTWAFIYQELGILRQKNESLEVEVSRMLKSVSHTLSLHEYGLRVDSDKDRIPCETLGLKQMVSVNKKEIKDKEEKLCSESTMRVTQYIYRAKKIDGP